MKHNFRRAAVSTAALTVAEVSRLNRAGVRAGHPLTDMLVLATLNPWNVEALACAPIELIDVERGLLRIPDPKSHVAEIALGFDAAVTVTIAVGDRSSGPLFCDADGSPFVPNEDARDYAAELLAEVDPGTAEIEWTFRDISESVFAHIVDAGHSLHVASAQAGLNPARHPGLDRRGLLHAQRMIADWWSWRLGLLAPSPFHIVRSFQTHDLRASFVETVEAGSTLQ